MTRIIIETENPHLARPIMEAADNHEAIRIEFNRVNGWAKEFEGKLVQTQVDALTDDAGVFEGYLYRITLG